MWFHCFSQVFFSFLFHSFIFCLLLVFFCCLVWVSFALLSLETSGGNSRLFENFFFSQKHILVLYIFLYVHPDWGAPYEVALLHFHLHSVQPIFLFLFNFGFDLWVTNRFEFKCKGKWKKKEWNCGNWNIILHWVLVGLKTQYWVLLEHWLNYHLNAIAKIWKTDAKEMY